MKRYDELIERVDFSSNFTDFSFLNYRLEFLKMSFVLLMFYIIYFSATGLQILMKVNVGYVLNCMLRMLMILFHRLNITFLRYFQIIKSSVMKLSYYLLNREEQDLI